MRFNGWKSVVALATVIAAYGAVLTRAQAQADAKAASVMADVKKALGGEQKIAALKGLAMRADYRRELSAGGGGGGTMTFVMMGGGGSTSTSQQTTGKIEIDLDLPNNYLRSDVGTAAFGMTRTEGFESARPFLEIVPNSPGMRIQVDSPASDPARANAALRRSHAELARLFIGLTGGAQPGFPVTYAYGGQAESPDGKADIIDVTGPDDFKCRLFVDAETHLPLMLSYMEPEARVMMRTVGGGAPGGRSGGPGPVVTSGGGTTAGGTTAPASPSAHTTAAGQTPPGLPPGLTKEQQDEIARQMREAEAAPPKLVEYRLFFSDYRKVDGLSLPYRIARGVGSKTTEEWDITSYKVNPSFKADRFKVGS
jgi:hypothetical protein